MNTYGKTIRERENMDSLKAAINQYCKQCYDTLITGGVLQESAPTDTIEKVEDILLDVDKDDFGMDPNGIDIEGAMVALDHIKKL
jgi:hypothetical protein